MSDKIEKYDGEKDLDGGADVTVLNGSDGVSDCFQVAFDHVDDCSRIVKRILGNLKPKTTRRFRSESEILSGCCKGMADQSVICE
jgi:hypothetical protein